MTNKRAHTTTVTNGKKSSFTARPFQPRVTLGKTRVYNVDLGDKTNHDMSSTVSETTSFTDHVQLPIATCKLTIPKNETIVRQYLSSMEDSRPMSSTNKEEVETTLVGQFRLIHSRVAVSLIEECMNSCKQLTLQKITASNYTAIEKINRPDYGASSFIPKEPNREWMLLAVVAQRGSVITDHEGNKSITLVLTDLKYSQCRLTLFDAALDAHWKTAPGSVVAVFNAKLFESNAKMGLSISRLECLLNIGDCIDFSMCIAANKDGSKCRMPVDKKKGTKCEWHCIEGVKRSISRRMEIAVGDVSMQVPSSSFDNNKDSSAVNMYQSSNYYEATPFGRASKLSSKALQERQKSEARMSALLKQHNNLGGIYLQSAITTHNERKKIKLAQEEEASANLAKNNTSNESRKPRVKKSALAILENAKGRPVDKEL